MINYDLPQEIEINGEIYPITRGGDYRVALDVITALNDRELSENDKVVVTLLMFYGTIPEDVQTALDKMMWFINCGEETDKNKEPEPPLMDWEQDFPLLVAPINKSLGTEIRSSEYLHWWTFIGGYMEIGECTFSTIANIRKKRMKGQTLDKQEQAFFRENADKIILKNRLSQDEIDFMNEEDW